MSIRSTITLSLALILGLALYLVPVITATTIQPSEAMRGCFGPVIWRNNGTGKNVTEKYPVNFGGSNGSGTALIRMSSNSVYADCANGSRPRKLKPLARVNCYTVVDFNIFSDNHLISIFKNAFYKHFEGARFSWKTFQPSKLKANNPPSRVTHSDNTRHNCREVQESLDDRIWFLKRDGVVQNLWASKTRMDNGGTLISDIGSYDWGNDVPIKVFPNG